MCAIQRDHAPSHVEVAADALHRGEDVRFSAADLAIGLLAKATA
jgi:hypothetical protein